MTARVRKYILRGSYGFLVTSEGQEIFFHLWGFLDKGGPPSIVGEEVEVTTITPSPQGLPRAESVCRVHAPILHMGVISKFDLAKGYGFIRDTDGLEYYLHKSDVSPSMVVAPGIGVRFYAGVLTQEGQRPRACHVTQDG